MHNGLRPSFLELLGSAGVCFSFLSDYPFYRRFPNRSLATVVRNSKLSAEGRP